MPEKDKRHVRHLKRLVDKTNLNEYLKNQIEIELANPSLFQKIRRAFGMSTHNEKCLRLLERMQAERAKEKDLRTVKAPANQKTNSLSGSLQACLKRINWQRLVIG